MHPLLEPSVVAAVEAAASAHRGRPWVMTGFTDLDDRASHPCGIFRGEPFGVFAKAAAEAQVTAELAGHRLLRERAAISTPTPVGAGVVLNADSALLLLEALDERPARADRDWAAIGETLAALHSVPGVAFGLGTDGWFGPLPQANTPCDTWAELYGRYRLIPMMRRAERAGHREIVRGVAGIMHRWDDLAGPEPTPSLLHGDAQQNNWVSTAAGAVPVDVAPYFGHPELDLAMLDYFAPVPRGCFDAYRAVRPIDPGFAERRELWRLYGYLAVLVVAGDTPFGRIYEQRLRDVVRSYR